MMIIAMALAIAARMVSGGPPNMTQILAVPMFMVAVAAVWLIASLHEKTESALLGGGRVQDDHHGHADSSQRHVMTGVTTSLTKCWSGDGMP